MAEIVIDRRFRGPDDSGNGGYTCGMIARAVGGPITVTLRAPPPLDVPMHVAAGRVSLDGALVAEFARAEVELEPPEPPPWDEALRAQRPDLESPFPNCFVCGHARAAGDGLHIHAGPVTGSDLVAAPWRPRPDTAAPEFVWAALDCPGAYATGALGRGVVVLGQLAARIERVPRPDEHCVVVGWPLGSDGRKHQAGTALYAGTELLAIARAVWIEPRRGG